MQRFIRHTWIRFAVLLAAGGTMLQTSTCNSDLNTLGQDLAISVVDRLITGYVADQFNLVGTPTGF